MFWFKLNQRGFNLFTALVAVVILLIAGLLMASMSQSENSVISRIYSMDESLKLQSVAETVKFDTLHAFNISLRQRFENYLTSKKSECLSVTSVTNCNEFTVYSAATFKEDDWDLIVNNFVKGTFLSKSGSADTFASEIANKLVDFYITPRNYENYVISLEVLSPSTSNLGTTTEARRITQEVIADALNQGSFEVVGCDGTKNNCEMGTFYFTFNIEDSITDESYESLPRIVIRDTITGNQIKQAILPKQNFSIYVPLRFFKALAEARALVHTSTATSFKDDFGLFSSRIHNELEEFALGMCDKGSCYPRTNPLKSSGLSGANLACPGSTYATGVKYMSSISVPCNPTDQQRGICDSALTYNPGDRASTSRALNELVKNRICDVAENSELGVGLSSDFVLIGSDCGADSKVAKINVESLSKDSVQVIRAISSNNAGSAPATSYTANANYSVGSVCPFVNTASSSKNGWFVKDGKLQHINIPNDQFSCSGAISSSTAYMLFCSELESYEVVLLFEEKNTQFMVNNSQKRIDEERVFAIKILDNTFNAFTNAWNANIDSSSCAFSSEPTKTGCAYSNGWTCISDADAGKCVPQ